LNIFRALIWIPTQVSILFHRQSNNVVSVVSPPPHSSFLYSFSLYCRTCSSVYWWSIFCHSLKNKQSCCLKSYNYDTQYSTRWFDETHGTIHILHCSMGLDGQQGLYFQHTSSYTCVYVQFMSSLCPVYVQFMSSSDNIILLSPRKQR
jgi:hypothetical protein